MTSNIFPQARGTFISGIWGGSRLSVENGPNKNKDQTPTKEVKPQQQVRGRAKDLDLLLLWIQVSL